MSNATDPHVSPRRRKTMSHRWAPPILMGAIILCLDQVTKAVIRSWLSERPEGRRWDAASDWLGLQYVENRGAAFGSLADYGGLLTVVALVLVAIATTAYARVDGPSSWLKVGLGLLVGGAIGNVIDRVVHGYVVDFVAIGGWPRFNLADSSITVGVLLLAWRLSGDEYTTATRAPVDVTSAAPGDRTSDERTPSARTNGK